jgi:hypothetical protein
MLEPVAAHPLMLVGPLVVYSVRRLLDAGKVSGVHDRIHIRNLQSAVKPWCLAAAVARSSTSGMRQRPRACTRCCTTTAPTPTLRCHTALFCPARFPARFFTHLAGEGAQHIQQGEDDEGDVALCRGVACARCAHK